MKARIVMLLAINAVCAAASYNVGPEVKGNLRVMSFNIRYINSEDTGARHWKKRLPLIVQMITQFKPDVIGLQEAKKSQIVDLEKALSKQYAWFGKQRVANILANEEYNPIFYNVKTVELLSHNTYGLSKDLKIGAKLVRSKEPRIVKVGKLEVKMGEKAEYALARIFTVGTFKIKSSGKQFTYINTHLDHKSNEIRTEQMNYLIGYLKSNSSLLSKPLFLGGDFNTATPFSELTALGMHDTRNAARIKTAVQGTFTNWNAHELPIEQAQQMGSLIDFIFYNQKGSIEQYAIVQRIVQKGGKQVEEIMSDHRPVFIDVQL